MLYGDLLKNVRIEKQMTQQELADRSGVPLPTLRGYEQCQRLPGLVVAIRLARALDVPLGVFAACDEAGDEAPAPKPRRPTGALPRKRKEAKGQ